MHKDRPGLFPAAATFPDYRTLLDAEALTLNHCDVILAFPRCENFVKSPGKRALLYLDYGVNDKCRTHRIPESSPMKLDSRVNQPRSAPRESFRNE